MPPSVQSRPGNELLMQCMSLPARQARHSPQVGVGCRITVSPTATLVTAEPISCTQPAFSCPIVYGSVGLHRRVPLALDDVQVGAAHPGAADLHDDVERALDRRLGHLVDHRLLVVAVQPNGFHLVLLTSPCRDVP